MGVDMVVVIISLDEHLVSSDGRMFFLTMEWDFSGAAQKGKRSSLLNFFPYAFNVSLSSLSDRKSVV